jgi:hypothetical protein
MKRLILLGLVAAAALAAAKNAQAAPYDFGANGWVEVDYWAGSGTNETIVVVDWNQSNGPYVSEAHAWGYRWTGTKYVADALAAIEAAGGLDITYGYGGNFIFHGFYTDADGDQHDSQTPNDYEGWWWLGDTADGGQTWTGNLVGIDEKELVDGRVEGLNMDSGSWTGDTLSVPVPEPATLALAAAGLGLALARRRKRARR